MTTIASTFDFSSSTFSRNATDFERSFFCALRYLLADPLTAAGKPNDPFQATVLALPNQPRSLKTWQKIE